MGRNYLDLEDICEDELIEMKEEVDQDITSIKIQIDEAKDKVIDGEYADRDWWLRVNGALRIKGRQSQQIQNAIGRVKRERKEKEQLQLERRFMNIARQELSYEVFNKILDQAKEV